MARHFRITINIAYDEAHGKLDSMEDELAQNVDFCVERGYLLNDVNEETVVEEWKCQVEEVV